MMNLFFDLDGTISDPFEGITKSFNYALAKYGLEEKPLEDLGQYIGPSLKTTFSELLNTNDEATLLEAVAFFRERYFTIGYKENELYEGIIELLTDLRESDHRLFIVTSKREDIARSVIEHFSLSHLFDGIHGCDIDLTKSQLIQNILATEFIEPSDTVMIGDRKFDIEAANENQLRSIGVLWGYGDTEELEQAGATTIARTLDELKNSINSL